MRYPRPQGIHPLAIVGHPAQHFKGCDANWGADVHPTAYIGAFSSVDNGTERTTIVGANTYVMQRVNIGHDCLIGENCDIADSVVVAGFCVVGDNVRIGIGAMIPPYRTIGQGARIGAGAVVIEKEIPPYECWAGNPAKKLYDLCFVCGGNVDAHDVGMCVMRRANRID